MKTHYRRHSRKLNKRQASLVTTLIVAILMAFFGKDAMTPQNQTVIHQNNPGNYKVVEFYDGDTIAVNMNGVKEKVRLIGVDTPETHDPRKAVQCFGQAASDFTKRTIGDSALRLEADPINQNRDRYNRLLRYVYLPDGRLLNAEIIKQGYGFAYLSFPFTKSDEFRKYQTEARESNLGLWSSCQPQQNEFGGYTSNDVTQ